MGPRLRRLIQSVPRSVRWGSALVFAAAGAAAGACAGGRSDAQERELPAAPLSAAAEGPLEPLAPEIAERFARLALDCVHREYPNKLAHVLASDEDVAAPRSLTPAFYGCFDWHSAVHGHWLLVRLLRLHPQASFAAEARAALTRSLTPEHIAGELAYLRRSDREGFERPYGLAWLLQLAAELRQWDDPEARRWIQALAPLEALAAERLRGWISKLSYPIRSGEHAQTGFALGLALDWARVAGDEAFASVVVQATRRFHDADRDCNLDLEPSGHDFLSPCLGAADLMRRVLPPGSFARWLDRALPAVPLDGSTGWLEPVTPSDRADGKLAHLDGLNLSRAWMLEGVALGLPAGDARRASLREAARVHAAAGLAAVTGEHYAGGHWLGSFAVYLITRRGVELATVR